MSKALSSPQTYSEATRLDRVRRTNDTTNLTPLRVVLAGNANFDFLSPALRVQLAIEGFDASVLTASFNNWISDVLEQREVSTADVWVIWISSMGATRGMTHRPEVDVGTIAAVAQKLLQRATKVILIHPDPMSVEDDPFSAFTTWRQELSRRLFDELPASVVQFSVEHIVRRIGMDSWSAPRYWEQAKAPCHPDAATKVAVETAVIVSRLFRPVVRAVAVDLDDTLWGGVVGEVGPEGLSLDPDGPGRAYLELQRLLIDLSSRGIPIGVVSKNDDEQARRPFTERPEMLLSVDSFVRFEASWQPKFEAIARFADQLNIGIDAVCFLDDSPKERDEARRMLPGLIVPELAESPAKRVDELLQSRLFTSPSVSDEDRTRVQFFKASTKPVAMDLDDYLRSLQMELDVVRIGGSNVERALALLHKTNQFNLTLWRPTPSALDSVVSDDAHYAYTFRLRDTVGDAGIVGVLLATAGGESAELKAWVLSCRVFSRGVEWAMAQHLAEWVAAQGIREVRGAHTHGPRNALVGDVMKQIGFVASGSTETATLFSAQHIAPPSHCITIGEP